MLFWVGVSDIPGGTDGEQGQQRADVLSVTAPMKPPAPNLRLIYRRNSNISVNMDPGKKTALTRPILILAAAAAVIILCCSAGCVISETTAAEEWTPEITQLTDYPEYNLYLAEYTHDDKLDELIAEHITDTGLLNRRIAELCAPGTDVRIKLPAPACTVFISSDATSEVTSEEPPEGSFEGQYLAGRNFDFGDTSCMLVHTVPDNGYESIAFADINMYASDPAGDPANPQDALISPYLCMDGLNEAGVFIAVLVADGPAVHQNTGKPVATAPFIIRLVLDKAADVYEAVLLIGDFDAHFASGFQYFIADKSGNTAVVNYIHDELTVVFGETILTNFYVCEIPEDYPEGHGQDRYEIAKTMLEDAGYETDSAKAFEILEAVAQTTEMLDPGTTQWSAVYYLTKGYADVVFRQHWDDVISSPHLSVVPV